jgi:hypothetical protein
MCGFPEPASPFDCPLVSVEIKTTSESQLIHWGPPPIAMGIVRDEDGEFVREMTAAERATEKSTCDAMWAKWRETGGRWRTRGRATTEAKFYSADGRVAEATLVDNEWVWRRFG